MLPLEETPSLIAQVYQRLLDAIADHTLAPGCRIRQGELAERLSVSRQPISHALHLLHRQGLVMEAGRKGFRVAPLDPDHILRLYEVRGALDGLAARLAACSRLDRASRRKLEDALRSGTEITPETPLPRLIELDVAFHRALYELSGNPVIEHTVGPQWPHMRRSMACVLSQPGYPVTVWEEHRAIVERVFAGDPDGAEHAAKSHALAAGRMTEAHLRASEAA
ncbi:GntR family transcriptional regulator [Bradyrhizobium sp. LHD-71]|uniref:GntR family transcriptional regulator n=1 Tax=Bradyrhizobium sp. LHD-71 TaxID=3072141 RepID=UPI00280FD1B0|nr:GntR family transcriptional regulator [Bradyrhizobium sp. LHD-71]MDQ8728379.1 GntR family transcriptional regulator [Bradyrhizobium sp. LHD-71]